MIIAKLNKSAPAIIPLNQRSQCQTVARAAAREGLTRVEVPSAITATLRFRIEFTRAPYFWLSSNNAVIVTIRIALLGCRVAGRIGVVCLGDDWISGPQ